MMGLNSEELERALCTRTMETSREKVTTALNVTQVRSLLPPEGTAWRVSLVAVATLILWPTLAGSICPGCFSQEHLQPPLQLDCEPHQREHQGEWLFSLNAPGLPYLLALVSSVRVRCCRCNDGAKSGTGDPVTSLVVFLFHKDPELHFEPEISTPVPTCQG